MTRTTIQKLRTARAQTFNALVRGETVHTARLITAAGVTGKEREDMRDALCAFCHSVVSRKALPPVPQADLAPAPLTIDYILESLGMLRRSHA